MNISNSNVFQKMLLKVIYFQFVRPVLAALSVNGLKRFYSLTCDDRKELTLINAPNVCYVNIFSSPVLIF